MTRWLRALDVGAWGRAPHQKLTVPMHVPGTPALWGAETRGSVEVTGHLASRFSERPGLKAVREATEQDTWDYRHCAIADSHRADVVTMCTCENTFLSVRFMPFWACLLSVIGICNACLIIHYTWSLKHWPEVCKASVDEANSCHRICEKNPILSYKTIDYFRENAIHDLVNKQIRHGNPV